MRKITSAEGHAAMWLAISTNTGKILNPQWHGAIGVISNLHHDLR